jgi:Methyltransferase FkbM domain
MAKAGTLTLATSRKDSEAGYFCNSTISAAPKSSRNVYHDVEAVPFAKVLASRKWTGIKMDVEGGEYDMLLGADKIPASVEWMMIEFHWLKDVGARLLPFAIERLKDAGLHTVWWPHGLSIRDGKPHTFHPFHEIIFVRDDAWAGATQGTALMAQYLQYGRAMHGKTPLLRDPARRALLNQCYGQPT